MEKLVTPDGPVRHIGVSNFSPKQMDELLATAKIKPAVHQFEAHPYLQQRDFVAWHQQRGIAVVGYAPLANTSPYYAPARISMTAPRSSTPTRPARPGTSRMRPVITRCTIWKTSATPSWCSPPWSFSAAPTSHFPFPTRCARKRAILAFLSRT